MLIDVPSILEVVPRFKACVAMDTIPRIPSVTQASTPAIFVWFVCFFFPSLERRSWENSSIKLFDECISLQSLLSQSLADTCTIFIEALNGYFGSAVQCSSSNE